MDHVYRRQPNFQLLSRETGQVFWPISLFRLPPDLSTGIACETMFQLRERRNVEEASDIYTITVVLFLIPIWILLVAWRRELGGEYELPQRNWRSYSLRLALSFATIATLTDMGFLLVQVRLIHFQGSFHIPAPSVGRLEIPLREIAKWSLAATVGLGVLAKGKGRLLVIGAALSILLVTILWFWTTVINNNYFHNKY
jgi:hypothetical protein